MKDSQNGSKSDEKENNKEIYAAPIITKHENLRLITKDEYSELFSDVVDVPPF